MTQNAASLQSLATRLERRAAVYPFVVALLGFVLGAPLGGAAMVGLNGVRRFEEIRSLEDVADAKENKGEELRSMFRRVPLAAGAAGIVVAAVGFFFGSSRALQMNAQAATARAVIDLQSR